MGTYLPWHGERYLWQVSRDNDERLVELLEREQVGFVLGDFWAVYPINFLSRERIRGIPWRDANDHHKAHLRRDGTPRRWALLATTDRELESWIEATGLSGRTYRIHDQYRLLVTEERSPPDSFLPRMRAAYRTGL